MAWKKQYTPEEQAAYQTQKRAEIEGIFKRIDEGVQQVFTSEKYRDYLKFMSRFTDYSARNTLLIAMQKPDATLVAAYSKWKQLGRQVSKGESGIEILAPVAYKTGTVEEIERPVADEFGNRQYNPDGTEKTEIVQNPVMDIAFKKAYVFDVSQTTGKEIPVPVSDLSGDLDSDRMSAVFKALQRVTGIEIQFADIPGGAKGYYSPADDKIVVQSGMSDAQTLKTAFHECAHKLLHDPDLKSVTTKSARNEKEVQAESTAFIVAERMGLDTSEYSFPYIASWSDGKQLDQLTKVLDEIQQAAKRMSSLIESELLKLQKRDLTIEEMLADTDLDNIQKAEILIDDCRERGIVFCEQDEDAILQCAGEHEDISDTVRLISDMEMTLVQIPETEEVPQDISQAEYVAALSFDTFNLRPKEAITMNKMQKSDKTQKSETLGNTPYQVLCRSQVQYFKGLKPRHAENIAKQLDADGIAFSGVRKDQTVTLTVRKVDVPQFEAAVAKVKAGYSKTRTAAPQQAQRYFDAPPRKPEPPVPEKQPPKAPKDVPIVTTSFVEARQNNRLNELWDSINASKACRDYIDQNLYDAYANRNLKGLVKQLEEQFGMERTLYTLAATIQLKSEDGRFTPEVKKEAARFTFDSDNMRLKFLTEQHPVRLNHLFEVLIVRARELAQAQTQQKKEQPKLSDFLSGQFLLSTERVSVHDDYRGIPETNYYNSSVNEYFVDGIGWLNEDAYDREQKLSSEPANQFYSKVSKINADCINSDGTVSKIDMTRQEYELMTSHTYAPENRQALAMAKAKLAEHKKDAGIHLKPTEQYAVRQSADHRYSVVTISADGLVTPVIPDLKSVPEAKKAMLEFYEQRNKTARCELVHPQVLDEKSAALYHAQEELPPVVYRIQLSRQKDSADTHYVQQYVKCSDDGYKVGKVMTHGDYFTCNSALSNLIAQKPEQKQDRFMDALLTAAVSSKPPAPETQTEQSAAPDMQETDFAIYQLKGGDETRDLRFEPYDRLTQQGQKPEMINYDLVYKGDMAEISDNPDLRIQLEAIFRKFNLERPDDFTGHSLSVSDVVVTRNQAFYVDSFGFKPLPGFLTPAITAPNLTEERFLEALPGRLQAIAEHTVNPAEDNLLKVSTEAAKLQIAPAIMQKAAEMVNDPHVEQMAETYAKRFHAGNSPEQQKKPKPQKPKL